MPATTPSHRTPAQLVLEGQVAAPDGPVDLAAMYVMHRAFRRDLERFERVVPTIPAADRRRWRRLRRRFSLFATVLHKHHHGEDVGLWPLLVARGADPSVLAALEVEHAEIDPLVAAVSADLEVLAAGGADGDRRRRLADGVARLRPAVEAHLAHEEREGMALVQALLTPEDWARLDEEVFSPDYTPREVPAVLGWVTSGLPEEAVRRMPGGGSAAFRAFALVVRRSFDRREARTFAVPRTTTRRDRVLVVVSRVLGRAHTWVLRTTGWRVGARWMGGDVVLLTHTGRRSGRRFTTPLLHVRDGDDVVVAASNGGIDHEPQWWLNLQADPAAVVEIAGTPTQVTAAAVVPADRDRLWADLMARCASYDGYQASVSREIALVRLTPVPTAAG